MGERGTTLSGGRQQRLGLARAIYDKPDLSVLDDALSAVDSSIAAHVMAHVGLPHAQRGEAVLFALNQ